MKKTGIIVILVLIALLGVGAWLLASTSPDRAERETVSVPVELPTGQ